ncbi:MAG: D-glycero-beta-D-manno-heptose 1,7-bisphosphate 7-phosphatase [Candidatus Latescibacterota bacterium]|jgi:D-glycero-D-manno-heptose 1,7-bisphosphate phosphatase
MAADPRPYPARHPAVFLDRDGTLNREVDHLHRVDDLELLPGTATALACLREAGFLLVVVTNQSAVARGLLTVPALEEIHAELQRRLAAAGARLDALYYCPHHPDEGDPPFRCRCDCRKPAPGLLHRAAADLGIDLTASYMVGDTRSDLEAGWAAGCRTVLVRTGYGSATLQEAGPELLDRVDHVAADLAAAARWIVG